MVYLIKYAEIAVKGDNRRLFEEALMKRIREVLRKLAESSGLPPYEVTRAQGRIYVDLKDMGAKSCRDGAADFSAGGNAPEEAGDDAPAGGRDFVGENPADRNSTQTGFAPEDMQENAAVIEALSRVFGITAICPAMALPDCDFETLAGHVVSYMDRTFRDKNRSFKVHARRARKNYPMNSMELDAELGARLLEAFPELHVDVHDPEILLQVEIRERIFVYAVSYPGPGGMPLGTAGKAMLLLSGGIDSPVAGYMVSKRGVSLEAVYFHAPPYTSERAKQKVADLARIISDYTGRLKLHVINFTEIQMAIYRECPHDELTIIMRRYMMRIAERIATESGCLGLVTGESIGQVASQTMASLLCTNAVCSLPVFRPLIGFDKQEIIEISERIGTYETSILPYEDCCTIFVAKHPVTKPKLAIIERHEKHLFKLPLETETEDGNGYTAGSIEELVENALETREIIEI